MLQRIGSTVAVALGALAVAPVLANHGANANAGANGDDVGARWKGKEVDSAALREELGEWPARAVEAWAPWAAEHGYVLRLSPDGRVLLVVHRRARSVAALEDLAADAAELVDRIAPAPERAEEPAAEMAPPAPGEPPPKPGRGRWRWTWKDDGAPLETETAVLLQAREAADYASALDLVAEREPYLAAWAAHGKKLAGCTLERPLFAAWLESGEGLEEWDPKNELVHRVAQLLVMRRFDEQPYWALCGIGWYVEEEIRGSIYCFPNRSEFVFATEHTAWGRELARELRERERLTAGHVAGLERGAFDGPSARLAWGAVRFLVDRKALAPVLERFRLLRDEKGVERGEDGSWTRVVGWEPSDEDVEQAIVEEVGPSAFDDLLAFLRKG